MQNYSISTRFGGFRVLSSKQLITYGHFQMVYSFENDVTLVSRVHIFRAPRLYCRQTDRKGPLSPSDGPRGQSRRRKVLSPVSFQNNGTLAVGHEREHRPSSLPKHYPHPMLREIDREEEGGERRLTLFFTRESNSIRTEFSCRNETFILLDRWV